MGRRQASRLTRTYLINTRPPKWSKLHRLVCIEEVTIRSSKMLFAVERVLMDTNQRQIALSVLESLRDDLMYAHLNNGGRVLDVADLRQYIYEQIRSEEHTSELQSQSNLVCRLL